MPVHTGKFKNWTQGFKNIFKYFLCVPNEGGGCRKDDTCEKEFDARYFMNELEVFIVTRMWP
jgi:hypothetical protein